MLQNNVFFNIPTQPWTNTRKKEFASTPQHHYQQAYRNIFGPSGSSNRDQHFIEMSHLRCAPSLTNPTSFRHSYERLTFGLEFGFVCPYSAFREGCMTSISSLDTEEGVDNFYSKKIVTGQVPNGTKYVFLLLLSIPLSDGRTERVRPWSV